MFFHSIGRVDLFACLKDGFFLPFVTYYSNYAFAVSNRAEDTGTTLLPDILIYFGIPGHHRGMMW